MLKFFFNLIDKTYRFYEEYIKSCYYKSRLGFCGKNVSFKAPSAYGDLKNIYMYDNTCILHKMIFLSSTGKLIVKKGAGISSGVVVITGNHGRKVGKPFRTGRDTDSSQDVETDIIIEEDAWVGANVTLCAGARIGRCANIGAGSVIRTHVPPYSVVIGNPAKIVGFSLTPEEIIIHEQELYPEAERLSLDVLEKNYKKYFLNRISDIKSFTKI